MGILFISKRGGIAYGYLWPTNPVETPWDVTLGATRSLVARRLLRRDMPTPQHAPLLLRLLRRCGPKLPPKGRREFLYG